MLPINAIDEKWWALESTTEVWGSVWHTIKDAGANEWLAVDFGAIINVFRVAILTR